MQKHNAVKCFNIKLSNFVAQKRKEGSQIYLLEFNTINFDDKDYKIDGIHLSTSGQEKMAQKWFEFITSK